MDRYTTYKNPAADKVQYPTSGIANGYTDYIDPIIKTDVTSEDLIWSKTLPHSWQGDPRSGFGFARATSPSVKFGGEEVQYISDTESEHSCSSADTMILLNNEQSGSQILDTCIPPRPRTYQPLPCNPIEQNARATPLQDIPRGAHPKTSASGYNQLLGAPKQQMTCQTVKSNEQSAPPSVDNHSDDGYESNDTNMSFETGSSLSLSSKDSGLQAEGPKSILKRAGQSSSKVTQRMVRFEADENGKHLENRIYGVPRQYVSEKSPEDMIKHVEAVKKPDNRKLTNKNTQNNSSLEERLKDLMLNDSPTKVDTRNTENEHYNDNVSMDYQDSSELQAYTDRSFTERGTGAVYRAVPVTLATIPEQNCSVDREEEIISLPDSPSSRVTIPSFLLDGQESRNQAEDPRDYQGDHHGYQNNQHGYQGNHHGYQEAEHQGYVVANQSRFGGDQHGYQKYPQNYQDVGYPYPRDQSNRDLNYRDNMSIQDKDLNTQNTRENNYGDPNYISAKQVENLLNRQSSMRVNSGTPPFASQDVHKLPHHSSLTNLPSQQEYSPQMRVPHSNSMPQLPPNNVRGNAISAVQNGLQLPVKNGYTHSESYRSSRETSPEFHNLSPDISPKARQRHSCYATYAELTEMYKSMAAGGRNKRWSNSTDLNLAHVTPNDLNNSKSKTIYGTTADLYRMMKDQMRYPKPSANSPHNYNSVT